MSKGATKRRKRATARLKMEHTDELRYLVGDAIDVDEFDRYLTSYWNDGQSGMRRLVRTLVLAKAGVLDPLCYNYRSADAQGMVQIRLDITEEQRAAIG